MPRWGRRIRVISLLASPVLLIAGLVVLKAWWPLLPSPVRRGVGDALLRGMLVVYAGLWLIGVPGTVVLTAILIRRRHGRRLAKGVLLGFSTLVSLALLEGASAFWLVQSHRLPRLPTTFPEKSDGPVRIAVIGESSALGEPYRPWVSVGQVVTWKLGEGQPGRRFEVEILARLGASLADMHEALVGLKRRPDALIIYCGHNEFTARFEEERDPFLDEEPGNPLLYRLYAASLRSPFCRLVYATISKNRLDEGPPLSNHHRLIDPPVCSPSEYAEVKGNFARRLEAIVSWCDRVGIVPILVIPPSNEGGFEPSRSVVRPATSAAERERIASQYGEAREAESRRDIAHAETLYRSILDRHPRFAEAHFRLARLREDEGDIVDANRHYLLARDSDGLPIRCPSDFQQVIRDVAARHGCPLIDGPAELRRTSPSGVVDGHVIIDAHHPTLNGTAALSEAILHILHERRFLGTTGSAPRVDPVACARHFGLDAGRWSAACERTEVHFRRTSGYRFDPSERLARARAFADVILRLSAGEPPEALGLLGPDAAGPRLKPED